MPTMDSKNESDDEDMDQDTPDSEKSDDDDMDSSGSEGESSELNEEECEIRRNDCVDDMSDLERQFVDLREQLYRERLFQIEAKLEEVRAGRAPEYLGPLAMLQDNMKTRTQVAGILKKLKLVNIRNNYECENQATRQNYESEKNLLYDSIKTDLEDKIRRLEEDRHNIDISSDLWNESQNMKKTRKKHDPMNPDRRRKPVTVSGPYIVYLLKDMDIIEDWTAIKKALKQQSSLQRRKGDLKFSSSGGKEFGRDYDIYDKSDD
ncbi:breast cancer metastasis-suppressor 1-like protein [Tubulanus polymorphus]|uniref:breast cancer metastasis-suppressor 1-like protein n=1 Tax=Tubulanus polymorphus TaxID=672921 RepID=UPI003DA22D40